MIRAPSIGIRHSVRGKSSIWHNRSDLWLAIDSFPHAAFSRYRLFTVVA